MTRQRRRLSFGRDEGIASSDAPNTGAMSDFWRAHTRREDRDCAVEELAEPGEDAAGHGIQAEAEGSAPANKLPPAIQLRHGPHYLPRN
jgi:hypothetical protein